MVWELKGKNQLTIYGSLEERKRSLPTNEFNANILLQLEQTWLPCVFIHTGVLACMFHSMRKEKLAKFLSSCA